MNGRAIRAALIELVGTFGLVFFSRRRSCASTSATPASAAGRHRRADPAPARPVRRRAAQGLILAVLLALTAPVTGGYLNPAIALTQWAFGRLDSRRAGLLVVAQVVGAILGGCLPAADLQCRDRAGVPAIGAPHVNPLAYPVLNQSALFAGSGVELLLTFFLVVAIFGIVGPAGDPLRSGLAPGMVQAAAVLVAFPLTGAALNPVRWFGPVVCDAVDGRQQPALVRLPRLPRRPRSSAPCLPAAVLRSACCRCRNAPRQDARAGEINDGCDRSVAYASGRE